VRFLQPVPVTLAPAQLAAGDTHPDDAADRQNPAEGDNGIYPTWHGAGIKKADSICPRNARKGNANNRRKSGNAEPDARSAHTKLHLVKRVSIGCPWRAWGNANTSIV
jgi:hypothetical protein